MHLLNKYSLIISLLFFYQFLIPSFIKKKAFSNCKIVRTTSLSNVTTKKRSHQFWYVIHIYNIREFTQFVECFSPFISQVVQWFNFQLQSEKVACREWLTFLYKVSSTWKLFERSQKKELNKFQFPLKLIQFGRWK